MLGIVSEYIKIITPNICLPTHGFLIRREMYKLTCIHGNRGEENVFFVP